MTLSSAMRRYIAEAIGTFALVAIGPGASMVAARTHAFGHMGVALAFGLVVTLSLHRAVTSAALTSIPQ